MRNILSDRRNTLPTSGALTTPISHKLLFYTPTTHDTAVNTQD